MKPLQIGNRIASIPIIQGGMGVGVSRSSLAGAVAKEGGIGVISTAQIGYDEEDFEGHENECNLRAIGKHIARAKVWLSAGYDHCGRPEGGWTSWFFERAAGRDHAGAV